MAYGLSYGNVGNASRRNRGIVQWIIIFDRQTDDDARVGMILGASRRVVKSLDWIGLKIHLFFTTKTEFNTRVLTYLPAMLKTSISKSKVPPGGIPHAGNPPAPYPSWAGMHSSRTSPTRAPKQPWSQPKKLTKQRQLRRQSSLSSSSRDTKSCTMCF